MVGKLNSDAAAATAAAAAGPKAGPALEEQIVQRARDGGAQGEPDYLEVRAAGVESWAGSPGAACVGGRRSVEHLPAAPARLPRSHRLAGLPVPFVARGARLHGPGVCQVQAAHEAGGG